MRVHPIFGALLWVDGFYPSLRLAGGVICRRPGITEYWLRVDDKAD